MRNKLQRSSSKVNSVLICYKCTFQDTLCMPLPYSEQTVLKENTSFKQMN
jgi:hypothetical protein